MYSPANLYLTNVTQNGSLKSAPATRNFGQRFFQDKWDARDAFNRAWMDSSSHSTACLPFGYDPRLASPIHPHTLVSVLERKARIF